MSTKHQYTGLNDAQVLESRQKHGANVLTPPKKKSTFVLLLEKFKDPLILILCVAGVMSLGISCYEVYGLGHDMTSFFEPVGIFVAIALATGLSFFFEQQADKEFSILNQVNDDEPVQVIRNANAITIPRRDVVVGDIVILNTGEEIPADAELLEAVSLSVDESTLTGEPICRKTTDEAQFDAEATFPSNHVMKGTKVMEGHGVCRVMAVGDATENGKVFESAQIDNSVKTPLNEQLDRLGHAITIASYIVGILIIVGRVGMFFVNEPFGWSEFITNFLQAVMIAVTLIVVSIPEGLPMAVTLSLAYSMRRMLKTNNLVRKMHACETMGATTVICTDKTGTLTQNKMQVDTASFYDESDRDLIYEGIAVNTTARLDMTDPTNPQVLGNPTEGALLLWLNSRSIDAEAIKEKVTRLAEIPFSTERKFMASVIKEESGRRILFVKGAPEIVLAMCHATAGDVKRETIEQQLVGFQNRAMRTLAFAYQILDDGENGVSEMIITAKRLIFMGIVAISDPVRSDVPDAVNECLDAGISIKIVTGDTPATAKEIGRQIGLWKDTDGDRNIITGPEFAALSDDELRDRILDMKIIARARPMDKKRLVETLQEKGQVVAVTGDGTNDAPALKSAHVGLSMGDGTSVAKEASDITIVDNSFASIGRAVMWGRSLYRNIQRFILFQMTVNVAACLIVLAGAFMGTESPLTVTQMLWVNLIMDTFAAMALASLPPNHSVMKDGPRDRRDFIINKTMKYNIFGVGALFFFILFGFLYVLEHASITSMTDLLHPEFGTGDGLSPYELSLFFTFFVFLQFWNLFNARAFATGRSAFHLKNCSEFLFIVCAILVGQVVIVTFGRQLFNVVPLALSDWLTIILSTALVLLVGELIRLILHRPRSK
jgi:Ca2+-transporting ATPase